MSVSIFCKSENLLREYEAMFLINISNLRDEAEQVKAARSLLEKHQVQITSCQKWDERKLYFEIKGQKRAAYILAIFHADTLVVNKLYADCELADHVLRTLIVQHDPTVVTSEASSLDIPIQEKKPAHLADEDSEEEEEEELVEN